MTTFEAICNFLTGHRISYRTVHHQPTFTSEESAKARGEEVKVGGKAMVIKVDDDFKLFVLSAAQKVDFKKLKEYFRSKSAAVRHPVPRDIRFATKEELLSLTGLVPGSVPPFGAPILNLELFIDRSVTQNEKIAFNAGSLTDSVVMSTTDYLSIANAVQLDFSLNEVIDQP